MKLPVRCWGRYGVSGLPIGWGGASTASRTGRAAVTWCGWLATATGGWQATNSVGSVTRGFRLQQRTT